MEPPFCYSCSLPVMERGSFCPGCGSLIRCRRCRALWERNARACVECGSLHDGDGMQVEKGIEPSPAHLNTLEFRESQTERALSARFTDAAVERVSGPLAALLTSRRVFSGSPATMHEPYVEVIDEAQDQHPEDPRTEKQGVEPGRTPQLSRRGDLERIQDVFRVEGDKLHLDLMDFKASSKSDASRRLTLLFLYAKELLGTGVVPRGELNEILTEAGLYDGNTRSWIPREPRIQCDAKAHTLRLRSTGRNEAQQHLNEVLDDSTSGSYRPGSTPSRRRAKSRVGDAESTSGKTRSPGTKASKMSKNAAKWIPKWESKQAEFGLEKGAVHSVLSGQTLGRKGMYGLWAIRTATCDEIKQVSGHDLASFLWAAFEIKVAPSNLQRALQHQSMSDLVEHVGGTQFQILPPGMKAAEPLVPRSLANAGKSARKAS